MAKKPVNALLRLCKKFEPDVKDRCWEWKACTSKTGYGKFNGPAGSLAHRNAYFFFRGDPGGLCVLHKCDNPRCVNPNHLFLGTHQDNMEDMDRKGRRVISPHFHPVSAPRAILKEWQVVAIKKFLKRHPAKVGQKGGPIPFLARWFGVGRHVVKHINNGENWRHVNV